MTTQQNNITREVRTRLIEVAGGTTQDLGLGRIIGQVLGDIYMTDGDSSLDAIGHNLGLSKAAVSIAARQLEPGLAAENLEEERPQELLPGGGSPGGGLAARGAGNGAGQDSHRRRGTQPC